VNIKMYAVKYVLLPLISAGVSYARIYFGITGGKNFAEILFQGEYQSCCIQLTKLYTAITQVHTYRQATYSASYY
jgi:hypothetical protein